MCIRDSSVVIAVSEGIRLKDNRYVCELGQSIDFVDAFGHKQLSGTANYLASYIAGEVGCKTRTIELSSLQMCIRDRNRTFLLRM